MEKIGLSFSVQALHVLKMYPCFIGVMPATITRVCYCISLYETTNEKGSARSLAQCGPGEMSFFFHSLSFVCILLPLLLVRSYSEENAEFQVSEPDTAVRANKHSALLLDKFF